MNFTETIDITVEESSEQPAPSPLADSPALQSVEGEQPQEEIEVFFLLPFASEEDAIADAVKKLESEAMCPNRDELAFIRTCYSSATLQAACPN
ncbi:MAG: hypothetical protein ICV54_19645 [Nostoc sp. C3-bin3]|nr:hypothetical protein [Nostoc sp. C3-bin3]